MTRLNIPLFVALAASILSAVPVDARDTLPHQRMIRKRGPAPMEAPGPIGAAVVVGLRARQLLGDPTTTSAAAATTSSSAAATTSEAASTSRAAATTSAAAATTSSSAAVATTSSSSSAAATTSSSGGLLDSLTSALLATSTSSSSTVESTSSTPTTSSTTPTSTSTTAAAPTSTTTQQQQQQQPTTSETPSLNIATTPAATSAKGAQTSVAVVTSTIAAAAAASESAAAKAKTAKITRNTIISLVVIASCIGGAIAIWTVIRKWKLSPSEKFDDRMQPIDWAPPPATGAHEDAIEEKSKHRRAGSGASHGSFTSGGVGQSEAGHGAKYTDSQHGHGYGMPAQDFPPPHDFTAGAAQPGYGQYYGGQQYAGGAGYADLQRGPSMSESTYSHGASVQRGLSYSRGPGGYEAQPGAAVPPLPNPYGGEYGYEDYTHQPAGQQQQQQAQGQAPYRAY